jgi:hypothetical protein
VPQLASGNGSSLGVLSGVAEVVVLGAASFVIVAGLELTVHIFILSIVSIFSFFIMSSSHAAISSNERYKAFFTAVND